jgi:hypothetical protein
MRTIIRTLDGPRRVVLAVAQDRQAVDVIQASVSGARADQLAKGIAVD